MQREITHPMYPRTPAAGKHPAESAREIASGSKAEGTELRLEGIQALQRRLTQFPNQ